MGNDRNGKSFLKNLHILELSGYNNSKTNKEKEKNMKDGALILLAVFVLIPLFIVTVGFVIALMGPWLGIPAVALISWLVIASTVGG